MLFAQHPFYIYTLASRVHIVIYFQSLLNKKWSLTFARDHKPKPTAIIKKPTPNHFLFTNYDSHL